MCILGMIHKQFIFVPGTGESLVTRRGYRLHVAPYVSSCVPYACNATRNCTNADQSDIQYYAPYFFPKSLCINIDIEEKIKYKRAEALNREQRSFTVDTFKRIYRGMHMGRYSKFRCLKDQDRRLLTSYLPQGRTWKFLQNLLSF